MTKVILLISMWLLPALATANCEYLFEALNQSLERRAVMYIDHGSYKTIVPVENVSPINSVAARVKRVYGQDLALLEEVTAQAEELESNHLFIIYWPKLFLQLSDVLPFRDLWSLIDNDIASRKH